MDDAWTSKDKCARCGDLMNYRPGESYTASTDGRVWHYGCAPSRAPVEAGRLAEVTPAMIDAGIGALMRFGFPRPPRRGMREAFEAMRDAAQPLASGIETEGQDSATRLGAEHESPTAEGGDAIPSPSEPPNKGVSDRD